MTDKNSSPISGLPLDQAFERWGDPEIYATWLAHEDAKQPVSMATGVPPNERVRRHKIYAEARDVLEEQLRKLLITGSLLASGIREGDDGRSVIIPSVWRMADICPEFDFVYANSMKFEEVEYFLATEVPSNIEEWPEWLTRHTDRMTAQLPLVPHFSPDYTHVSLGDLEFVFGNLQARAMRYLHNAAQSDDPWRPGKAILHDIGSQSAKMSELFKRQKEWRTLIESDGKGKYRLKV